MNCSLCGKRSEQQGKVSYCSGCIKLLENGSVPEISYRDLFTDDLEEKLEEVENALMAMKDNFFLWYLKGTLEHELGSLKKAQRSINTSLSYKQDFGDAWIRSGLIYSDMHRDSEAVENYEKGLKYELYDPSTIVEAGVSLQAMDNAELAARLLEAGLGLSPEDPRAVVTLGKVYSQMGQVDKAKKALEKGCELFPHNEEVLRGIARLLIRENDLEGAKEYYSRILDRSPKDFEALLALAEIHIRRCELKRSMKYYRAVEDLDIHISWPGILRFVVSSLSEIVDRNENSSTYNDDLTKEFNNIRNFVSELDAKLDRTTGSGPLSEVENLIRTLENQRQRLGEEIERYRDMLKAYRVDDSFHAHLSKKVEDLERNLAGYRIFDARQISSELSPFLSDLGRIDGKAYDNIISKIEERTDQLEELGSEVKDLRSKMGQLEEMKGKGDLQGAKFLLKELEIAVDGHWEEVGRDYHEQRSAEMEKIINEAKDRFDTSGLREEYRSFETTFSDGPLVMRDAYGAFMERYRKDSGKYLLKEAGSALQEIKYRLVILEKDGADVGDLKERMEELVDGEDQEPEKLLEHTTELVEKVNRLDEDFKLQMIDNRLERVQRLHRNLRSIGIKGDLLDSIGSVTATIRRAKDQSNPRLAEILSDELFGNVEKTLEKDHLPQIKAACSDLGSRIERLSGLGIGQERASGMLHDLERDLLEGRGSKIDGIEGLIALREDVERRSAEEVPEEILGRIKSIRAITEEAGVLNIELEEERAIDELEADLEDGADLELLEKTVRVELNLMEALVKGIEEKTRTINEENMDSIEALSREGADGEDFIDVVSKVSRSNLLIEKNARDALDLAIATRGEIGSLILRSQHNGVERRRKHVAKVLELSESMGMDVGGFKKEMRDLDKGDACEMDELRTRADTLLKRVNNAFMKGLSARINDLDRSVRGLLKEQGDCVRREDQEAMNERIHTLKVKIADGELLSVPPLLEEATVMHNDMMACIDHHMVASMLDDMESRVASIDREGTEAIVMRITALRKRLEEEEMGGIDAELSEIEEELSSLESLELMSRIEKLLGDIDDLENSAREVFENIKDPALSGKKGDISREVHRLMVNSSRLLKDPTPGELQRTLESISNLRGDLQGLENEGRALSRLRVIDTIPALVKKEMDEDIKGDVRSLRQMFDKREWEGFFRMWDRIGERMVFLSARKAEGETMPEAEEVKRLDSAISRRRKPAVRTTDHSATGKIGSLESGAIGKIASQAFAKHMMMDDKEPDAEGIEEKEVSVDELEELLEMEEIIDEETNKSLAGVARLIAGSRIQDLKKKDSIALTDIEVEIRPAGEGPEGSSGNLDTLMEDFLDMDTTYEGMTVSDDVLRSKDKLDRLFRKLPHIKALREPKEHYTRGGALLEEGRPDRAKKEFKAATSKALKILKVHKDIDAALKTLRGALDRAKDSGLYLKESEEVYEIARGHHSRGELIESARAIKRIRDILKARR